MELIGAHSILYSRKPEADRAFLRDVLGLRGVDVGGGWLIFGLPPGEVAVHPSTKNDVHEFYLMCGNADTLVARLRQRRVRCSPIQDMGWNRAAGVRFANGRPNVSSPERSPADGRHPN